MLHSDVLSHTTTGRRIPGLSGPWISGAVLAAASFVNPLGRWLNLGSRLMPSILSPATRESADCSNRHVVVTNDLAAQSNARQAPRRQHVAFGHRHLIGLAIDELHAARRATRIPTAGVQLVDTSILLESQDEPLALRHFELTETLDSKRRHDDSVWFACSSGLQRTTQYVIRHDEGSNRNMP